MNKRRDEESQLGQRLHSFKSWIRAFFENMSFDPDSVLVPAVSLAFLGAYTSATLLHTAWIAMCYAEKRKRLSERLPPESESRRKTYV